MSLDRISFRLPDMILDLVEKILHWIYKLCRGKRCNTCGHRMKNHQRPDPWKPVLTMEDLRIKQPEQELPHQNRHTRRQVNAAIKRVQRRHDRKKK